ncbi:hypothetical protein D9619_009407 [Psilocybe cf. subviscida]|uniref:WD40 repeat-like protein n=1 Tax=Psilocybe cf. subviscida TaxID=2480587 RepID=A0A8H5FAC3_9AGAR|nr:hypothetical protein D9619_009407 [Psilocybe cf. subviscida]
MSDANSTCIVLPVLTVQNSFSEVIKEVQDGFTPYDRFWVSCYKASEPSVHTKIRAELDDRDRNLVLLKSEEDGVDIKRESSGSYSISCRSLGLPPTTVITPVQEYTDKDRANPAQPQRITAFDVAPDGSRYATGFLDGSVLIYPTRPTEQQVDSLIAQNVEVTTAKTISRPHLSAVQSLKFFPSSQVILSSGLDFSLAVLPGTLSEGNSRVPTRVSPVRTLRAHTRSVTDTAIIGLGRNILSASLDSTVKLWEVSSGDVLASLATSSGVNRISLGERPPTPPDDESPAPPSSVTDAREQPEVASKVVFCALQSGSFELLDLGAKKSVFLSPRGTDGALTSIVYDEAHALLATGSARGTVCVYDVRALAAPVTSFRRLETAIQDLVFVHRTNGAVDLAVATSDGLPYVASVVPEGPAVRAELVGPDCDPVKNVVVRSATEGGRLELWSSSDDSIVRRYVL